MRFAEVYKSMATTILHPKYSVDFTCRGLAMAQEITNCTLKIDIENGKQLSVFSCEGHRVTPMRFALAELCYILAGRDDVASIASYNKAMAHYSDDGVTIGGSYGIRLKQQLPVLIERLKKDIYTRQACAAIFWQTDCINQTKHHMPCNVFLQFLCRPPLLDLHVTSRSSDFVTGFSIDTLHWQALLIMMASELQAAGFAVVPNRVNYNIASLHVYKADMLMMEEWQSVHMPYLSFEHLLTLPITLSEAIRRSTECFTDGMTVNGLGYMLDMSEEDVQKLGQLDLLFRQHKNKVIR